MMKNTKDAFLESKLIIRCNVQTKIDSNLERKYKKELEEVLKMPESLKSDKKKFIFNFCKKIIIFYFIEQFYGWVNSYNNSLSNYINKQVDAVEQVKESPIVFEEEFNKLMSRIKKAHVKQINSLKKILDYIMECIEKITRKEYAEFYDRKLSIELIDILESIPSKYFKREKIVVDLDKGVDENILKLLGCYDQYYDYANRERKYNCIERIMDLSFPKMSEGYEAFLDIIAKSCDAYNQISNDDNLILILDEPDRALHPELARNFLFKLLESLNNYEHKGTIQIVMSSHSPFIVTDILPNNVYLLDRQDNLQTKVEKVKNTFATNIYYLLMNSFMMDNTFGEYSYRKIEDIIKELRSSKLIQHERLQNIKSIIDLINEERVKRKLLELYDDYCFKHDINKSDKDTLINKIRNLENDEKLKQVMRILEENDRDSNR